MGRHFRPDRVESRSVFQHVPTNYHNAVTAIEKIWGVVLARVGRNQARLSGLSLLLRPQRSVSSSPSEQTLTSGELIRKRIKMCILCTLLSWTSHRGIYLA